MCTHTCTCAHAHVALLSVSSYMLMFCFFSRDRQTKQKKNCPKSPHCTAKFIALSPDPIPSLAVLLTEKQAFQRAALQSWELCLEIWLQYIYMHSRAIQCKYIGYPTPIILQCSDNGRHVHTMYVCVATPTHIAHGCKTFYTNIWETLQSAITLILRRESKFCLVKLLVLMHAHIKSMS